MDSNKPKNLVSFEERASIARKVQEWLNTYEDKPCNVEYEYLAEFGLTQSTTQAAYKTKQFIDGTYQAQYQFSLIYRTLTMSDSERLEATEMLDKFGAWAEATLPDLGEAVAQKVVCTTNAALIARYENNIEDYQINLTLTYEVV